MSLLFIDDLRVPADVPHYMRLDADLYVMYQRKDWTVVRNFEELKTYILSNPMPEFISFDHDLGANGSTHEQLPSGYDCAKWLLDYVMDGQLPLPRILCHSQNPVGKENILNLFDNYKKQLPS